MISQSQLEKLRGHVPPVPHWFLCLCSTVLLSEQATQNNKTSFLDNPFTEISNGMYRDV